MRMRIAVGGTTEAGLVYGALYLEDIAVAREMQMAANTCLAGLVEFLQEKPGVRDVKVKAGKPATAADIIGWERMYLCSMPEDLKLFYQTHNGLSLQWSYLHNGVVAPLGRVSVNPISQLQPLVAAQSQSHSSTDNRPSLLDLEPDTDENGGGQWCPSLSGSNSVYVLDYCSTSGHTCLASQPPHNEDAHYSVWLLDLGLSWHHLSNSFSDYLRLAVVHLGLRQWPYALTPNRLSWEYERWFHLFIPHRLEVDMTGSVDSSSHTQWKKPEKEGAGVTANVVDITKILQPKSSRDKRSKLPKPPPQQPLPRKSSFSKSSN